MQWGMMLYETLVKLLNCSASSEPFAILLARMVPFDYDGDAPSCSRNVKKCAIQLRIDHNTNVPTSLHPGVGGNRKWIITPLPFWEFHHCFMLDFMGILTYCSVLQSLLSFHRVIRYVYLQEPYTICRVTLFHSFVWLWCDSSGLTHFLV